MLIMSKKLIFLYHNIIERERNLYLYDVSFKAFKKQIEYLKQLSGKRVSVGKLLDKSNSFLDVIISFDDGYRSWTGEVLELLLSANFKAYFFICIEHLENSLIKKEDILRLKNSGMVIGAHSMTHRFLTLLKREEIYYELKQSKEVLENILGDKVNCFSIPRGIYNNDVVRIAQEVGYEYLFTSDVGINEKIGFKLKRIPVKRNTSLENFINIINGKNIRKMIFQENIKNISKKIFGIKIYDYWRRILIPEAED